MASSSSCVPGRYLDVGFKFLPTDQELLGYYLLNKVYGKPFKCDPRVMNEENIYKAEPWDLWNNYGGEGLHHGEDLFFFTTVKKVNANGSNVVRTVGSGTWKGDTAGVKVYDSKNKKKILGSWKRFHFVPNKPNENGSWIMFEFKLDDSLIPKSCTEDLVLCRIRKDRKRKSIDDQTNNTLQYTSRKVPTRGIRTILNNDTNLPAREEEQKPQQQQEVDSYKQQLLPSSSHFYEQEQHQLLRNELTVPSDHYMFQRVGTYDPIYNVQLKPNAVISHQQNNLGIPYFQDQQQQVLLGNDHMGYSDQDNFQRVNEHESYLMSTYENQTLNNEINPMTSGFTQWLSSEEGEPNDMSEGQQTLVSFEPEDQQLRQQDQQLLLSTSDCHEQQHFLSNHLMVSSDHEHRNAQPNPDTLVSHQPNNVGIPTESQSNDLFTMDDLFPGDTGTGNDPHTAAPNPDTLVSHQPNNVGIPTESQSNDLFTMDDLFPGDTGTGNDPHTAAPASVHTMEHSDCATFKFSSLDDNVFSEINLTTFGR